MKIGVWLPSGILASNIGGGYSYPQKLISAIDNHKFHESIELVFLSLDDIIGFNCPSKNVSRLKHLKRLFKNCSFISRCLFHLDKSLINFIGLKRILKGTGIKLVIYTEQMVCFDPDFPFVAMNWDIGHLSTYPFPEIISSYRQRDDFYRKVLPKAILVSCESNSGKEEIKEYTTLGEHKLRVVPLFAGNVASLSLSQIEIEKNLNQLHLVPNTYFYYPAQFWAHKNHIGLLKAFKRFIDTTDKNCKLVLSGSRRSNYSYVVQTIRELELESNVIVLGFISNEMVYSLYKGAISLVMASHFGTTNMPPIEAMEIGCPVACSGLAGHKEILGDSGVYFNSYDEGSILNALIEVYRNNSKYREKILEQGKNSLFKVEKAIEFLEVLLLESVVIRSNWE